MKIMQTILFRNANTEKKPPVLFNNRIIQEDSFVRTKAQTPSFKANAENIYSKILSNPKKAEQFMGLIAAGAAALIAAADINCDSKNSETVNDGGNIFTNLLSGIFKQNQNNNNIENEINKYKEENERLKNENENLKAKLNTEENKKEQQAEIESKQTTKTFFPKKRGRLTQNQQNLKIVTENLNLDEKTAEEMKAICTELFTKKSHFIDNQIKDNDSITKDFTDELKNSNNDAQKIKEIINKYFVLCELAAQDINNSKTENNITNECAENKGIKVVGKINLLPQQKKPERIIRDQDGNIQSLFFKKAGSVPQYYAEQLDEIYKYFVKIIYNDYKEKINPDKEKPMWLYNTPVPKRIRKTDIAREIKKQNNPDERYEHITPADYQLIADTINEDSRYNELFDIHSALRLFDRFIDFESVDTGIDIQSKKILDKLFEMIEQAYKDGVQIKVYKDKKSGFIGPSIVLQAENFDKEAFNLFGSTDIVIGISERQNGKNYIGVDNNKKEAIISTIYAKSM